MWSIFGSKKIPYDRVAHLIRRGSIATSAECSEAMERFFFLKPEFDLLMYDTIAFFMAISLSELMLRENGSTKEDYERLERELTRAVGQCGVEKPKFFLYAMMPTDERFGCSTFYYYRGCLENFGISQSELHSYAQEYDFNIPASDGFAMSVLALYVHVIKIMAVEKIGKPSVEKLAVMKMTELVGNNVKVFIAQVKRVL